MKKDNIPDRIENHETGYSIFPDIDPFRLNLVYLSQKLIIPRIPNILRHDPITCRQEFRVHIIDAYIRWRIRWPVTP